MTAMTEVQYLYSVYWALTTLTTVGYGDITPTNDIERWYALGCLLVGAIIFGYMISTIGSLVTSMDRQSALVQDKTDSIKEYIAWRRMPRRLGVRVRKFYEYYYTRLPAFKEADILSELTPSLRADVTNFLLKETVGNMPLFSRLGPDFQSEVFPRLKPLSATAKEMIFRRGDRARDLFFLLKGEVWVRSPFEEHVTIATLHPGEYFGESVLTGRRRENTHQAAMFCDLFSLAHEDIEILFSKFPQASASVYEQVQKVTLSKDRLASFLHKALIAWMPKTSQRSALVIQHAWHAFDHAKALRNVPFAAVTQVLIERRRSVSHGSPSDALLMLSPNGEPSVDLFTQKQVVAQVDVLTQSVKRMEQMLAAIDKKVGLWA